MPPQGSEDLLLSLAVSRAQDDKGVLADQVAQAVLAWTPNDNGGVDIAAHVGLGTLDIGKGSAAPQTLAKTTFASNAAVPWWDVSARWSGNELVAASVSVDVKPTTGLNLWWWGSDGQVKGSAAAANAIGVGTAFSSVGWSWKNPGQADGCFWVSGTVTNKDKPASILTYDVCCQ